MLKGRVLRMEALIHGILSYAKAGKIKCESKVIDLNYLLNEIIDSLNPPSFFKSIYKIIYLLLKQNKQNYFRYSVILSAMQLNTMIK